MPLDETNQPRDHAYEPSGLSAIDIAVRAISSPVTVIAGTAQLWQRRIRRGDALDHARLLEDLGRIEQASRSIDRHLRHLEGHDPHHDGHTAPRPEAHSGDRR